MKIKSVDEAVELIDKIGVFLADHKLDAVQTSVSKFRDKFGRAPLRPIWWVNAMIPQITDDDIKRKPWNNNHK